ncbi:MAG: YraN family protein [Bryobacterales bacterium]|nr:YraN family protein [Bryobacterales bacterium]
MIAAWIAKLRSLADRELPQRLRDGRRGEELAYRHLQREGYKVVARNYRSKSGKGEIDLLGWDGEMLACVEVKTRKNADFGRPEEFVGSEKQRHLIQAAHNYARRAKVDPARLRYDVVSVVLEPAPVIELYKDVFTERREPRRYPR